MLSRVGTLYLAALIVGLGTIGLQFVLSHIGGDVGHGMDGMGGHDFGHDLGHGGLGHDGDGPNVLAGAAVFLSFRFWTFALMAFGMVGAALHYLALAGFSTTLVLSIVVGVISGLAASLTFRALSRGVTSSETTQDAVGKVGRVLVPAHKGQTGKVRIEIKGKTLDVLATSDAEVVEGDHVLVVEMRGTSAHVEPVSGGESGPQ